MDRTTYVAAMEWIFYPTWGQDKAQATLTSPSPA